MLSLQTGLFSGSSRKAGCGTWVTSGVFLHHVDSRQSLENESYEGVKEKKKHTKPSNINCGNFIHNKPMPNLRSSSFSFCSGLNQQKYKVLEMDRNGTLYLYRSSLLCVNEIIKRLTEGTYQMAEPSMLGRLPETDVINQARASSKQ